MMYTVAELAKLINGEVEGDPNVEITGIAKIEEACPGEMTFLANPQYERFLETTQASAIIISNDQKASGKTVIRVPDPYLSFAELLGVFYPPEKAPDPGIDSSAHVSENAKIGKNCCIGANVVIGSDSSLGKNVIIYPNAFIGDHVVIGDDTTLHAGVSVRYGVRIGSRVTIQNNSVVGSAGFGFAPKETGDYEKIPQVGNVIIEDDVEIGAGCTIDRATLGATRIEKGVKLDNLIQVAHNVVIGKNTVIAAQTGISGSTEIGERCMIGGQVGFVGHIKLGNGSMVGAQSGVPKSFGDGSKISGSPAKPHREELLIQVMQKKLTDFYKRLDLLEKQIEEYQKKGNER
ncbi:UDP-3-O-(3-hydroxymyristoyl)glucosamine N-acyltransferase [candidate division LCP-89 bacterium B3_LCP]|uniref:UDP-3-O-acylglucosamine N-acyltransferase n=1 Tax=candidate division LCP-89 bacterium B3_LCP TaxID=2012998 RepID=A0A532UXY4_UNCL8|nr:MAG: UDP-3-O-(3-hydroxymyristoyl)glucosamine N-acyltransferase [candidate division LCP-89 bacterium B3_LCP]